jgi:hypothetical protein
MLLFEGWSKGRHLMSGERGGVPVRVLDLTTIVERQESREVWNRTVALVPAEGLPAFDVRPRTRASRLLRMARVEGVTFDPQGVADPAAASDVAEFGALFHLMPSAAKPAGILGADFAPEVEDSERALRRLFTPRLMRAFNRHPGHSAQAAGGALAVWRGGSFLPARERTGLVDAALELRAALNGAAAAQATGRAEPAVPARPGTDPDSQSDRLRNTVVGAILGFYLGFGAGVCVIFSGRFPKLQGGALAAGVGTLVVVLGCVVLGVALCAFLGSRVPVRPHAGAHPGTPLTPSQRATRPRFTTAGTVAGFVLGFFGGFAVFATAMSGIHPKAPAPALMAPVFFGSIGLGATAGAVGGGKAARFLYDRRRSRREDPVTSRVPGSPSEVR